MEVGAREPESPEAQADERQLQAAFALLQRAFRPGKSRGKGGEPGSSKIPGGPCLRAAPRAPGRA
eukprot:103591-Alexandrium_andersonii.AAC.1